MIRRREVLANLEEQLLQIAPELSAQQAQTVIEMFDVAGLQLFFTSTNGRSVKRLIRHYLHDNGEMPLAVVKGEAKARRVNECQVPTMWRLPVGLREKTQFAKCLLEVLAVPDKAVLEKLDADLERVSGAIAALSLVSRDAVRDSISELNDAKSILETKRQMLLESKPWVIRAVPNSSIPKAGARKAERVQDEDDDFAEEDDA